MGWVFFFACVLKDAETNLGLTAVVPKDCSQCVHRVPFSILAFRSLSYSVAPKAVPCPSETEGWKTDFGGGEAGKGGVCFDF